MTATISAVRAQLRDLTDDGFIFFLTGGELAYSTFRGLLTPERERWIEQHASAIRSIVHEHGLPVPAGWTLEQEGTA